MEMKINPIQYKFIHNTYKYEIMNNPNEAIVNADTDSFAHLTRFSSV